MTLTDATYSGASTRGFLVQICVIYAIILKDELTKVLHRWLDQAICLFADLYPQSNSVHGVRTYIIYLKAKLEDTAQVLPLPPRP